MSSAGRRPKIEGILSPRFTIRAGLLCVCVAAALAFPLRSRADDSPAPMTDHKAEIEAAWQAASKTGTKGPTEIKLLDQATLTIAADELFVPSAEATQIMRAYGNPTDASTIGLVVGTTTADQWLVIIKRVKDGYVRDGDAKEWEADALLDSLKQGTEAANKDRVTRGFPELTVEGWVQPPAYDSAAHRLVWSLSLGQKGAGGPGPGPGNINYNTYALGRDGYFSLNLLTNPVNIAHDKPIVQALLGGLTYLPGKRYEDFDNSTDKVAEYGLAALIGAVAIKKLGLLAAFGLFALKIWKVGLIAVLGMGAAIRRWFSGRRA
jgi:uncharacterized membrane-anchored protein